MVMKQILVMNMSNEFIVMMLTLRNAPTTSFSLMNNVSHGFLNDFLVVYLDDIVVYSNTFVKHLMHFWRVFERPLRKARKRAILVFKRLGS